MCPPAKESFADWMDLAKCAQVLREERWPDGTVRCPFCHCDSVIILEPYQEVFFRYQCHSCTRQNGYKTTFNEKSGTLFEGSKLSLTKWFYAISLLKNKVSSHEMAKELQVDVNTARRMSMLLRGEILFSNQAESDPLSEEVEADEVYITAGSKGNNQTRPNHRAPRRRGLKKKDAAPMRRTKPPCSVSSSVRAVWIYPL